MFAELYFVCFEMPKSIIHQDNWTWPQKFGIIDKFCKFCRNSLQNATFHIVVYYVLVIIQCRVQYGKYFPSFLYFCFLFHEPLGEWNNSKNIRNEENMPYCTKLMCDNWFIIRECFGKQKQTLNSSIRFIRKSNQGKTYSKTKNTFIKMFEIKKKIVKHVGFQLFVSQ